MERPEVPDPPTKYHCKVLDGAAIVHCLPTISISTFNDYAEHVFIPYLEQQLHSSDRIDVVWDSYVPDSLKESTREKRGKGVRRKVSGQAKLPSDWMNFLRDSQNKGELFSYLSGKVADHRFPEGKVVYITLG
jgi:hypothetical protein